MVYRDNTAFQAAILSESQESTLVLTSGGRLARHLRHRYREAQMASGKAGWSSPHFLSLNAWACKTWNMTWPSKSALSHVTCLYLWKEASSRVPPPEPFLADLKLFEILDETYTVLIRHGLSPEGPADSATPLLSWRREVMHTFQALAAELNGFHPAFLPAYLAEAIQEGLVRLPEVILLAAFEAPAPIEETLFDSLSRVSSLRRFDLPAGTPNKISRVSMPSRKQEVTWLTRQLVIDAQTIPLNRIGVVVPDTETYTPGIKQAFREIMGEPLEQATSAYNISVGAPLLQRSLIQSGLLPLRFWVEGQPRTLLLSIVLSTYCSLWKTNRDKVAQADRLWRQHGLDAGLDPLLSVLSDQAPDIFSGLNKGSPTLAESLGAFVQESDRTGSGWVRTLEAFWNAVGFPAIADEADTGAWRHFRKLLHRIREELETIPMSLADFTGLLQHLLSEEIVHVRGSEEAGIQILGLIESRGLSFQKLYVLGLSAGTLPRPVRPLPLLDVWERHRVQGATAESQYMFGREAFRHLLACAPHVTLLRPEEESAEPLAPSPFWTQVVAEETCASLDPWNAPDSVWARATWLQQANKGLAEPAAFPPDDPPVEGYLLPNTLSVSQLSSAFICPFRFYVETILNLLPLDEPVMGVSPLERGNRLHKVLASFTRRCRSEGLIEKKDGAVMNELLRVCSDEVLSGNTGEVRYTGKDTLTQHGWDMERRRWTSDNDATPGLLTQWLSLELQRLDEGWYWLGEESYFDGLTVSGFPCALVGRIDRIDNHDDKGIMLWDYKSGEHPTSQAVLEHLIDPQIPAYVKAAKEQRITEIRQEIGPNVQISGGYIALKRLSSVSHKDLRPKRGDWDIVLQQWQESVVRLGEILTSGQFQAVPYPVSEVVKQEKACLYCQYRPLCGRKESTP